MIYVYRCETEDKLFEVKQRMSDTPLDKCPDCGGKAHRVLQARPFKFERKVHNDNIQ